MKEPYRARRLASKEWILTLLELGNGQLGIGAACALLSGEAGEFENALLLF